MRLRRYQEEAIEASILEYINGVTRQLMILPCGSGKTVIFTSLIKKYMDLVNRSIKVLVIAHRDYLLEQSHQKLKEVFPRCDAGIHGWEKQICITTPLRARKKPREVIETYDICIIDEAHHSTAITYRSFLMKGFIDSDSKLLLGVTATPERLDQIGLNTIFQKVVFEKSVGWMIEHKFQVPVICFRETIKFPKLKIRNGDFALKDLEQIMNNKKTNLRVLYAYQSHIEKKKTIIFACSIKHAQELSEMFKTAGIQNAIIHSKLSQADRDKYLESYRLGRIKTIINCQILTEGFDDSETEAVLIARPTMSKALYIQMVGRAMRPGQNKRYGYVVDVTDNDNKLVTTSSIEGLGFMKCDFDSNLHPETKITKCTKCRLQFCTAHGSTLYRLCKTCSPKTACKYCLSLGYNQIKCKHCGNIFCSQCGHIEKMECYKCIPKNDQIQRDRSPLKKSERIHLFTSLPWVSRANGYFYKDKNISMAAMYNNATKKYQVKINNKCSTNEYCLEYAFEKMERYLIKNNLHKNLKLIRPSTEAQQNYLRFVIGIKDYDKYSYKAAQSLIIKDKAKKNKKNRKGKNV